MPHGLDHWKKLLASKPLPIFQETAKTMARIAAHQRITPAQVHEPTLRDPALTAAVFHALEEAMDGRRHVNIPTLGRAIGSYGASRIPGLAASQPVAERALSVQISSRYRAVAARCHQAANQLRSWLQLRNRPQEDPDPDQAYVATLLSGIGELAMWAHASKEMEAVQSLIEDGTEPQDAEQQILGCTCEQISAELANYWMLPKLVNTCLGEESAYSSECVGVTLAMRLLRTAQNATDDTALQVLLQQLAVFLHLPPQQCLHHILETAQDSSRAGLFTDLANPLMAVRWMSKPQATPKPVPRKVRPQAQEPLATETDDTDARLTLEQALASLNATGDQAINTDEAIKLTVRALHQGLKLSRVMYAGLSFDGRLLQSRYVLSERPDEGLQDFEAEMQPPNLFSRLLEKPQVLWINDETHERYCAFIPREASEMLRCESLFLASVVAGDRPLGVLFADRREGSNKLDEEAYQGFRKLTAHLTAHLSRLA
jgi:HD-like signal output (HDOD) protein